ncbi:MAG TPA: 3-hydroxyacyl-CoA dehydrogenase/enoyl-CoA hydratase family protein [Vicinamibacterales bacterium]|nr:3-hydroxyacyl-CoA dehydrogenase/enoyl-CoA hydratase family protein [Vicinamibacterales bacterium]
MTIRTAAVLGAGTMGAQIAAHLANAGVPVLLLDVSPDVAREGLQRAQAMKPDPFFTPATAALITTGGFDDGLARAGGADWVIEAVVERIDVKRALLDRLEPHRREDAIVSSNTSGIPIGAIAEGRTPAFRRRWLGTHFFNPPRYLHLLEVIPTPDTDPAVVETIRGFADRRLGKAVVLAKDTPNFIANRIGLFGVMQIFRALERGNYTIEEIDAITGPAIGRPKSATFRTIDIAGLDVLAHVARNLAERLDDADERAAFTLPPLIEKMVAGGMVGAKSGRGFYRKEGDEILTLDPSTLEYRPRQSPRLPSLDAAKNIDDVGERIRTLTADGGKVGEFLRATLLPTLDYAARVAPLVAHRPEDVDDAMRWGFGWELGPLETCAALEASGEGPAHANSPVFRKSLTLLGLARQSSRVVRRNAGASLVDLGDGVLCVEFHSKMNTIGGDTIQMLHAGISEASANFAALVIGNDAANFSAGANIMLLLLEAQEGNWDEVDLMVRAFQGMTMALKHAAVPVVAAPAGLTLGGGCEIALHAARVQAAAESYIGLVEVGVGLIPAGGGTKELLARAMECTPADGDILPSVQRVFETIGFAKVATSAPHARELGYMREGDGITMNRDRVIEDAKAYALRLAADGYRPAQPRQAIRVGGEGLLATLKLGVHLAWRAGHISDHDALIGRKLAWVLSGGDAPHETTMTEQQLLDLEREAFLSLCGERKTQERMAYTLKTGKTLRN